MAKSLRTFEKKESNVTIAEIYLMWFVRQNKQHRHFYLTNQCNIYGLSMKKVDVGRENLIGMWIQAKSQLKVPIKTISIVLSTYFGNPFFSFFNKRGLFYHIHVKNAICNNPFSFLWKAN